MTQNHADDAHTLAIAKAAGREGARELLLMLGVDVSTPVGIQRAQRNFVFLDDLRVGTAAVKRRIFFGIIAAVITTIAAWVALGFKH